MKALTFNDLYKYITVQLKKNQNGQNFTITEKYLHKYIKSQ